MANLRISEYEVMPVMLGQIMLAPQEPRIAAQKIAFTGTAGQSAAFNASTKFIRVQVDADACFLVGADPTATTDDAPLTAKVTEFFGVYPGQKISVVANS